jgi:hypothetical protein
MAKQIQTEDATAGIGADQGDSVQDPQPSASAAATAGAVRPGALAAAEMTSATNAQLKRAAEGSGDEELTHEDIKTLRGLAQRVGGVDTLIRWLQLHTDLK